MICFGPHPVAQTKTGELRDGVKFYRLTSVLFHSNAHRTKTAWAPTPHILHGQQNTLPVCRGWSRIKHIIRKLTFYTANNYWSEGPVIDLSSGISFRRSRSGGGPTSFHLDSSHPSPAPTHPNSLGLTKPLINLHSRCQPWSTMACSDAYSSFVSYNEYTGLTNFVMKGKPGNRGTKWANGLHIELSFRSHVIAITQ